MESGTLKIGNSNVSIALTLVGILPLIGGLFGLYKVILHYESGINYSWLFQALFLTAFGLAACGYRSSLILYNEYGVIVRKILAFPVARKKLRYDQFDEIFVDMDIGVVSANSSSEPYYYSVSLRGNSRILYFDDFISFKKLVKNKKSWELIREMVDEMATLTGLKVCYSDKVKRYNSVE